MSVIISNAPIPSDIPRTIPGLQIWLDANDSNFMTFSASNALSQWRDKSSNNFVFNTINGNPLLLSDNFKQGVFFNSALSNLMRTTTTVPFTSNVTTVFAVGSLTSTMVGISMMISFGSLQDVSLRFGNVGQNTNDFFYSNAINYNGSNPTSYPAGPTNYFVANGVLGPVIGGATASSNLQLSSDSFSYTRAYHGYINEVIIYSNTLTSAQRLQVEGYLAWKWGVLPRFPANYTYANSNPSLTIPQSYPYAGRTTTDNLQNPLSSRVTSYNWQPNNISGLIIWYDSADTTTLSNSGQNTFSWSSKGSISPLTMTLSAGSNAPIVSNYYGFPGLYCSNTKLVTSGTVTSFGTSATTWITCATNFSPITSSSPVDASLVIGYSATNSERAIRFDCNINVTSYTINTGTQRGEINNSNGVRGFIDQANYLRTYTNGTNTYVNNSIVTYNQGLNVTGLQMASWSAGALWGHIHEVLIFNRELGLDEYQKAEAYLSWKYGYQKQLPSTHPYYWFPPN